MRTKLLIAACLLFGAGVGHGSDIAGGYTFTSGELVTHTKLNALGAGSINTSFFSGKSSAGANPNTAFQILLRDTANDVFKRTTIADLFDHSSLLSGRSALSAPAAEDTLLIYDVSATTYKAVALSNLFVGVPAFSGVVSSNDYLMYFDSSAGTIHGLQISNLIAGCTALGDEDGDESLMVVTGAGNVRKIKIKELITLATDLQGSAALSGVASVWVLQSSTPRETRVLDFFQGGNSSSAPGTTDTFGLTDGSQLKRATFGTIKSNILGGYVCLQDQQANAVDGGGVTNSWSARHLNTIAADPLGLVTAGPGATNAFTLSAGTYRYRVVCPGFQVGAHQCMLTNQTAGTVVGLGNMARSGTADNTGSPTEAVGLLTNASASVYGIRHRAQTANNTDGGGPSNSWGGLNIYATIELWKLD